MPVTFRDYLPLAEENEGSVPWMYLDTAGHVTVGIGHRLGNATAAGALSFVEQQSGRFAGQDAVRTAFAAVRDARNLIGHVAADFAVLTTLRLSRATILAVYERDFSEIVEDIRSRLRLVGGGLDSYPEPAQIAVIDMAFNLGPGRLYNEYQRFRHDGLALRDFEAAARESYRHGISSARNSRTKTLLLEAARVEASLR